MMQKDMFQAAVLPEITVGDVLRQYGYCADVFNGWSVARHKFEPRLFIAGSDWRGGPATVRLVCEATAFQCLDGVVSKIPTEWSYTWELVRLSEVSVKSGAWGAFGAVHDQVEYARRTVGDVVAVAQGIGGGVK